MATITTVSATYERKFNLGDYNSAHIGITLWADLDDEDDPEKVRGSLFEQAKATVKAQAMPIISNQRAQVEKAFLGLPEEVQNEIMELAYNGNGNYYQKKGEEQWQFED